MIIVQDRIDVAAEQVDALLTLFYEDYRPAAAQRGLQFLATHVSPPVCLQRQPVTVWIRWQVADIATWWAMRAQSGNTPEVFEVWARVDRLCHHRERTYLVPPTHDLSTRSVDVRQWEVETRGHRETAQLSLRGDVVGTKAVQSFQALLHEAEHSLPGLERGILSENLAPGYAAGHYTWDLLFADASVAEDARSTAFWKDQIIPALAQHCDAVHAVALETLGAGLRDPGLTNGIKRTLLCRLLPDVSAAARHFETDLLEMPAQIPEIRNWRLSRAQPLSWSRMTDPLWTYVWEQEFEDVAGLQGPYMVHPHHWAHIDRWFDPESGVQAVDTRLSHAFSELSESLMALEAVR